MGKIIQKIEFVLENVDVIIFNKEDIDIMFITDITEYIYGDEVRKQCQHVFMKIKSEANVLYPQLGTSDEVKKFDRLTEYADITSIEFHYADGTMDICAVPWNDNDEYINRYQQTFIDNNGNLYISIDKKQGIKGILKKFHIM